MRVASSLLTSTGIRDRLNPNINNEPMIMALLVRVDLKMGTGKIAAQCAHGAVAAVEKCMDVKDTERSSQEVLEPSWKWPYWLESWIEKDNRSTLTFKASNEDVLTSTAKAAKQCGLPFYLVRDAGRTQIAKGCKTVTAVGPAPKSEVIEVCEGLESL